MGLGRSAVIRLTEKQTLAGDAEQFLNELFEKMGVQATASATEEEKSIKVDIAGDSTGILIGRRGETLDSLQYLTSLVVNKGTQEYKRITLDTENYRAKREETLVALANRIAAKVARTGKRVVLEPMNPYEPICRRDDPRLRSFVRAGLKPEIFARHMGYAKLSATT